MATTMVVLPEILKSSASGEDIAAALISITQAGASPLEGFQIMLRSASSERAAEITRGLIEQHHQKSIAGALSGPMVAQRAALMLSLIAGFQVMRQMTGLTALGDAKARSLVKVLGPLFQQLIDGEKKDG
jgi:Tetracyclin repressor-like, C-terminal domain